MDETIEVWAFTDGAAKGNPGPGGWGAVLWVARSTVCELGGSGGHTTNNRMELTAALRALEWIGAAAGAAASRTTILTDSTYLIRGVTVWTKSWKRRGWKTAEGGDVANRDLWEALEIALARCAKVEWRYVRGHVGTPGNERADAIATGFASGKHVDLYQGAYRGYAHDLAAIPQPGAAPSPKESAKAKKAYSYLSVVDGVPARHATWAECERRVKGRSGARYKKAASAEDEEAMLAEWGFSLQDLPSGPSVTKG
ncbi:MAG TPA: RNase H family protein [Candidatus Limnocylindrales bacterium]|nr:RNase H family protein [Candidatus Limnocylindrales bacterium]